LLVYIGVGVSQMDAITRHLRFDATKGFGSDYRVVRCT
jgi:hypothetical protein